MGAEGMRAGRVFFIVNPHAGEGSVGRQWPHILDRARQCLGEIRFRLTEGPGDAVKATREALLGGADIIVCVGGDGTLSEVVTGMMDKLGPSALRHFSGWFRKERDATSHEPSGFL